MFFALFKHVVQSLRMPLLVPSLSASRGSAFAGRFAVRT